MAVWSACQTPECSTADVERAAYILNLSTDTVLRQPLGDPYRQYQTSNDTPSGPAFGAGDLQVNVSLAGTLALQYFCGALNTPCEIGGSSMVGTSAVAFACDEPIDGAQTGFAIGALEVSTFAPTAAVPESASLLLPGTGLIGAVRAVRKRSARRTMRA